jgi:putative tryptophan/tyrosine transport system substrate-binding protein
MKRRDAVLGLCAVGITALSRFAPAQSRHAHIGYLAPGRESVFLPSIQKRLRENGYVEGKNVTVHYRSADGDVQRFEALARELIARKCDLVFAVGTEHPAIALRRAGTLIPVILIAVSYDPVKIGLVTNLARPSGNITGMYVPLPELAAKHVQLMHETLPAAKHFMVLGDALTSEHLPVVRQTAERLGIRIVPETFTSPPPYDLEPAFARATNAGAEALIVLDSRPFFDQRKKVGELTTKYRLPTAVNVHYFDQPGFLFCYGANFHTAFERAGDIAVSILNGTKPGDIPLQQPAEFELAVNLSAAKALQIVIPGSILARANRIID